jgi:hypothetical protein
MLNFREFELVENVVLNNLKRFAEMYSIPGVAERYRSIQHLDGMYDENGRRIRGRAKLATLERTWGLAIGEDGEYRDEYMIDFIKVPSYIVTVSLDDQDANARLLVDPAFIVSNHALDNDKATILGRMLRIALEASRLRWGTSTKIEVNVRLY